MRIEKNKIYNMDCIEGMKKLDDNSVDLIICDYPFNCQDERKDYFEFVKETADEFFRLLKDGGNLLIINNPTNMFKISKYFENFNFRNGVALIRKGSLRPAWMLGFQHNYMYLLIKGDNKKIKWNGTKKNHDKEFKTDVIQYQNGYRGKKNMWHPQAIPLDFTKFFIEILSDKNDIVLDPFMGSGTTAVACDGLQRDYIGFEISKKYCDIAEQRLDKWKEQKRLF